jgi:hypothetical protein
MESLKLTWAFALLCTMSDDQLMKNMNSFCVKKTKFHSNKNIEACNLNLKISIFNSKTLNEIQIWNTFQKEKEKKGCKLQIGAKGIKILFMSMVLNFIFFKLRKDTNLKRQVSFYFFPWELAKQIPIWNSHPINKLIN